MMDALLPLASLPVQIAGRNRVWRDMIVDDLRGDPDYRGGDYTAEPLRGLKAAWTSSGSSGRHRSTTKR